jgi:hypothetical protein
VPWPLAVLVPHQCPHRGSSGWTASRCPSRDTLKGSCAGFVVAVVGGAALRSPLGPAVAAQLARTGRARPESGCLTRGALMITKDPQLIRCFSYTKRKSARGHGRSDTVGA